VLIAGVVVSLLVVARTVDRVMANPTEQGINRILPAGHAKEECVDVPDGGRLAYSFTATDMVYFNVHHHVGRETVYDVERYETLTAENALDVPEAARYCLTFSSAASDEIQIEGRFGIVEIRQTDVRVAEPAEMNAVGN